MAGATARLRFGGAVLALAIGLSVAPAGRHVLASGEDSAVLLAESVMAAAAADLDGDGDRELVGIVLDSSAPDARFRVDAWVEDTDGWRTVRGGAVAVRDDGDDQPRAARIGSDSVGLLVLDQGHRQRVLVVAVGGIADVAGCCLTLSDVGIRDGALELATLAGSFGPAESVSTLDVDGDGVDELLVTASEYLADEPPQYTFRVLRATGDGFATEAIDLSEGSDPHYLAYVGETDGVRGDDILIADERGLYRIFADGDEMRSDAAASRVLGWAASGGWVAGATAGKLVAVSEEGLAVFEWPRDGELRRVASRPGTGFPSAFVFGEGRHARIVEIDGLGIGHGTPSGLTIHDLELSDSVSVRPDAEVERLWQLVASSSSSIQEISHLLYPHVGPLPGGLPDGRPAFFAAGTLLILEDDGSLVRSPAGPIVGSGVIGAVGVGNQSFALGQGWFGAGDSVYLYLQQRGDGGRLMTAPLGALMGDDLPDAPLDVEIAGAVVIDGGEDGHLVAADNGFSVTVAGPEGSTLVAVAGRRVVEQVELGTDPVTVAIDSPGSRATNETFDVTVVLLSPIGLAGVAAWEAEVLREPPELTVHSDTPVFSLRSTIFGRVADGATVMVDDHAVTSNGTGAYRIELDAPIWPRDVVVVARDLVGNETVERLEIVGFLDYRGLPWVPIVGVVTAALGVLLFVRTPRHRPLQLAADGDGRLEEIDGDTL